MTIQNSAWREIKMNWNLFLLIFYGKVLLIYIFVGYLLVRYIRKGWIRFNPEIMIQCRLKEVLRKRKKTVNFLINSEYGFCKL